MNIPEKSLRGHSVHGDGFSSLPAPRQPGDPKRDAQSELDAFSTSRTLGEREPFTYSVLTWIDLYDIYRHVGGSLPAWRIRAADYALRMGLDDSFIWAEEVRA
jgi:hypothetical protein